MPCIFSLTISLSLQTWTKETTTIMYLHIHKTRVFGGASSLASWLSIFWDYSCNNIRVQFNFKWITYLVLRLLQGFTTWNCSWDETSSFLHISEYYPWSSYKERSFITSWKKADILSTFYSYNHNQETFFRSQRPGCSVFQLQQCRKSVKYANTLITCGWYMACLIRFWRLIQVVKKVGEHGAPTNWIGGRRGRGKTRRDMAIWNVPGVTFSQHIAHQRITLWSAHKCYNVLPIGELHCGVHIARCTTCLSRHSSSFSKKVK